MTEEELITELLGRGYELQIIKNEIGLPIEEKIEGIIEETSVKAIRRYIYEPLIEKIIVGIPVISALILKEIIYEVIK